MAPNGLQSGGTAADTSCTLVLACSVLSKGGWLLSPHFGLLCCSRGRRLHQQSDEGHLGDECLWGPWPWAIPMVIPARKNADPWAKFSVHHWHTVNLLTLSSPLGFRKTPGVKKISLYDQISEKIRQILQGLTVKVRVVYLKVILPSLPH